MKLLVLIVLVCLHRSYGNALNRLSKRELSLNQSFIRGGVRATVFDHMSMSHLKIRYATYWRECDGAILNKLFVLTAANCIGGAVKSVTIIVSTTNLGEPQVKHFASRYLKHTAWKGTPDYDIAVVKSSTPFKFSRILQASKLATADTKIKTEEMLTIVGWGVDNSSKGGAVDPAMMETKLPVVDFGTCEINYGKKDVNIKFSTHSFCAGFLEGGVGVCAGEAGTAAINQHHVLVGILSTVHGCVAPGYPGIYTEVAAHLDWIHDAINKLS